MSNEVTQETRPRMGKLNEYFGKNWRRISLTQKDEIVKLLHELEIENYEFIRIASRILINDDRCVVIVIAKRVDNGHLAKIAIDVKLGDPTWRQLTDLMYGFGSDSDVKIIVLAGESSREVAPPVEEFWLSNYLRWVNCCGVHIYLAEAEDALLRENKMGISYSLIEGPGDSYQKNGSRLPSREEFEEKEFWIGCYNFVGQFGFPFMDSFEQMERGI